MPHKKSFNLTLTSFMLLILLSGSAQALNLIDNGDFSAGIDGWSVTSIRMGSGAPYTGGGYSVVDDGPHQQALQLNSLSSSNYYIRLQQTHAIPSGTGGFLVSLDWTVPQKETPWGRCNLDVFFYDANDQAIGLIRWVDHSYSNAHSKPAPYSSGLPEGYYYVDERYRTTFGWEHGAVDTRTDLPLLDFDDVEYLTMYLISSNDAGSGGRVLIDNIVVEPLAGGNIPEPATMLAGIAGLAGIGRYIRRRKKLTR